MMKKRFDWYRFVTISMVVVGIGFFLFSLLVSRLVFRDDKTPVTRREVVLEVPDEVPVQKPIRLSPMVSGKTEESTEELSDVAPKVLTATVEPRRKENLVGPLIEDDGDDGKDGEEKEEIFANRNKDIRQANSQTSKTPEEVLDFSTSWPASGTYYVRDYLLYGPKGDADFTNQLEAALAEDTDATIHHLNPADPNSGVTIHLTDGTVMPAYLFFFNSSQ